MKSIFQHIERVKGKPHHVRKRVAFATATTLTALVAAIWLVGSVSSGVFALKATSFADSAGAGGTLTTSGGESPANLAGAAAAPAAARTSSRIEIIDTSSSTSKKAEQTTIPF